MRCMLTVFINIVECFLQQVLLLLAARVRRALLPAAPFCESMAAERRTAGTVARGAASNSRSR
jgi:hypothetical protein